MANSYLAQLNDSYKKEYILKIHEIGGEDPYESVQYIQDINLWPDISYIDICNYLVYSVNWVTQEQMKSYKSLEAHNYFTSGLVNRQIFVRKVSSDLTILRGEVKHSQSVNANQLKVWIAAKSTGEIKTAHCTCMAGQGESCSHVGAFLFAVSTKLRLEKEKSCTDNKNRWLEPNYKDTLNKRISELDFSSADMKKRKTFHYTATEMKHVTSVKAPTVSEINNFFNAVAATGIQSAILAIVPEHSSNFKRDSIILKNLYDEKCQKLNFSEILEYCKKLFYSNMIKISQNKAEEIELCTTKQNKSKKWFEYRAGRITASIMKAACHSNPHDPSVSLIRKICNPRGCRILTEATSWGCLHEKTALNVYVKKMQSHEKFSFKKSGFVINPKYPHLGATPDGKVECSCCGKGVVEIKCPFCIRENSISEIINKKSSCLEMDGLKNINVKKDHPYYYQSQAQIFICNADFCDFIIWTEKEVFTERIFPDEIFWEEIEEKSATFFVHAVLPEIVGQWFSRNKK